MHSLLSYAGACLVVTAFWGRKVIAKKLFGSARRDDSDLVEADFVLKSDLHSIRECCRRFVPLWDQTLDSHLAVAAISGGITNQLWKVTHHDPPEGAFKHVLVRLYGENTEMFIDRDYEKRVIHEFAKRHFFFPLTASFKNGRIERWIESRSLEPQDMSKEALIPKIARRVAALHSLDMPFDKRVLGVWHNISKWITMGSVDGKRYDWGPVTESKDDSVPDFNQIDVAFLTREMRALKAILDQVNSPVVFCHNDLLSGNILQTIKGDLQLIDFEYAAFNPRGFDIGNHFNEYAGFECDYSLYPDEKAQRAFYRAYLQEASGTLTVEDSEIAQLSKEANMYSLASHMYWGTWSLVQSRYSSIDFDYKSYAQLRLSEYFKQKKALLPSQ